MMKSDLKKLITSTNQEYAIRDVTNGHFGDFYHVEQDGKHFTLKIIEKDDRYSEAFALEKEILHRISLTNNENLFISRYTTGHIQHPKNLTYVPYTTYDLHGPHILETKLAGTKYDHILIYSPETVVQIMKQMKAALKVLHQLDVIVSLQPENIVFQDFVPTMTIVRKGLNATMIKVENPTIKIGKFKCSTVLDSENETPLVRPSLIYRAPEDILGLDITKNVDLWAFGCIVFEMYAGSALFRPTCQNHIVQSHLVMMQHVLNEFIPQTMLAASMKTKKRMVALNPLGKYQLSQTNDIRYPIEIPPLSKYVYKDNASKTIIFGNLTTVLKIEPEKRTLAD